MPIIGSKRLLSAGLAALAVLTLLAAGAAEAHHSPGHGGGPGGGGEDPPAAVDVGWIYSYGGDVFRTDPDSGATSPVAGAPTDYGCDLPGCTGGGSVGVPSHDTYDGDRWYVAWRYTSADIIFPGVQGPYNQRALEIDAVREGDTTGVRLTDNRNSCIYAGGTFPSWTTDGSGAPDTAVTWLGAQWQDLDGDPLGDCETFVKAGIWRADLQRDASGAIIGADAPVLEVEVPVDTNFNLQNIGGWAWSPDGTQLAYGEAGRVWVADAGAPLASRTSIVQDMNTGSFDWSPDQDPATAGDQTTIAFTGTENTGGRKSGVWTVAPNGSGLTRVATGYVSSNHKKPSIYLIHPSWSPAGTHLAYMEAEILSFNRVDTIRRMAADGSDNVALAGDEPGRDLRLLMGWQNVD